MSKKSNQTIEITEEVLEQAQKFKSLGFDEFDAVHLASAENAKVDIFLTTDDNLQKVFNRNRNVLPFVVINPVNWLEEVLK